MKEYENITRDDIENKLSEGHLFTNRVISSALFLVPFLFFLVILVFFNQSSFSNEEVNLNSVVDILINIFFLFALVIYSGFLFYPKIFLKKDNIIKQLSNPTSGLNNTMSNDPVIKLIGVDRIIMIIRLAMLEGITLFGFVILFLSIQSNLIYSNALYWLLAIPLLVLGMVVLSNYISKEKTVTRIENDILRVINGF